MPPSPVRLAICLFVRSVTGPWLTDRVAWCPAVDIDGFHHRVRTRLTPVGTFGAFAVGEREAGFRLFVNRSATPYSCANKHRPNRFLGNRPFWPGCSAAADAQLNCNRLPWSSSTPSFGTSTARDYRRWHSMFLADVNIVSPAAATVVVGVMMLSPAGCAVVMLVTRRSTHRILVVRRSRAVAATSSSCKWRATSRTLPPAVTSRADR